ncbi:MAG: hypothetical protein QMD01_01060 [Thermodesulfovibrionales bacterium]|nr:hypothetical protein [Thermodesulfovibrionales bacterium]
MAKKKLKEKEILEVLKNEGFQEVGAVQKKSGWYKKASKRPACLTGKLHKIQVS